MSKKILNFATRILSETIKHGGTLVSPEQAQARINVCKGDPESGTPRCDFEGIVEPVPFLKMEGCTNCGCPFSTKPHMGTHFSISKLSIITTECPLKRWEAVDKLFKNNE